MADILNRIRKLVKLSKNNNSPEEAASAAAQAQELMFKYQIGEADLDLGDNCREVEKIVDESVLTDKSARREVWKSRLAHQLALAFGCQMYTWREVSECRYCVVGVESAVQTVSYIFGCLVLEINRMADEGWSEARQVPFASARTWKNSFRMGAVATIADRLKAKRRAQEAKVRDMAAEVERSGATSTALALYQTEQERVKEEYAQISKTKGLRPGRRHTYACAMSAYERGRQAGSEVGLGSTEKGLPAPAKRVEG